MRDLNLKQMLAKAIFPKAANDLLPLGGTLGGLGEPGKVSLVLHGGDCQPSLMLLQSMFREEGHAPKCIDIKGSAATACKQLNLCDNHRSLVEAIRLPRSERLEAVTHRVETLAAMTDCPGTLVILGVDGLGYLSDLGDDQRFQKALSDFVASGRSIVMTAIIPEWRPFAFIEEARVLADRVFGAERLYPTPVGTRKFRLINLTDRHQLDEPTFAYSGKNMTEKLASMLRK